MLLREPQLVRAVVLIEPPVLWLASGGAEATSSLRAAIEEGAAAHGSGGAINAFAREVCGPDVLEVVGQERSLAALKYPRAFAADIGAGANWSVPPRDLRAIATPITFVAGTRTPQAYREPCEALAAMIPGAELREADSSHMLPNEAPEVVVEAVRALAQG